MEKLFTLRETEMAKVVFEMGYKSFVIDAEQGVEMLKILSSAEVYEGKYHSAVDGNPSYTTQHIYPLDPTSAQISLKLISNESYKMYKLAGKPQD
jgi:hypothetical protein